MVLFNVEKRKKIEREMIELAIAGSRKISIYKYVIYGLFANVCITFAMKYHYDRWI